MGLRPPDKARKKKSLTGQLADNTECNQANVDMPESSKNGRNQNSPNQISKIRLRREQSEEGNEVMRIQTPLPPLKINLTPPSNKQATVRPLLIKTSPASRKLSPPRASPPSKTLGQLKLKIKAQNGVMFSEFRSGEKTDSDNANDDEKIDNREEVSTGVSGPIDNVKRKRGRPPKIVKPDSTQNDLDKNELDNSAPKVNNCNFYFNHH